MNRYNVFPSPSVRISPRSDNATVTVASDWSDAAVVVGASVAAVVGSAAGSSSAAHAVAIIATASNAIDTRFIASLPSISKLSTSAGGDRFR